MDTFLCLDKDSAFNEELLEHLESQPIPYTTGVLDGVCYHHDNIYGWHFRAEYPVELPPVLQGKDFFYDCFVRKDEVYDEQLADGIYKSVDGSLFGMVKSCYRDGLRVSSILIEQKVPDTVTGFRDELEALNDFHTAIMQQTIKPIIPWTVRRASANPNSSDDHVVLKIVIVLFESMKTSDQPPNLR